MLRLAPQEPTFPQFAAWCKTVGFLPSEGTEPALKPKPDCEPTTPKLKLSRCPDSEAAERFVRHSTVDRGLRRGENEEPPNTNAKVTAARRTASQGGHAQNSR